MIKVKLCTIVLVIAFLVNCQLSNALMTPSGTAYSAPTGGTLVISEDYGTDYDGTGTWSNAGGGELTTTNDSMIVSVDNSSAYVPLPWRPRATNYVIDIGIKSWTTTQTGATQFSAAWYLENEDGGGSNYSTAFIMRPGGDLYTSSTTPYAPFAQGTEHVVRFSDPTGVWAPYTAEAILNLGDVVKDETPGGYQILENALLLKGIEGRNATVEISWLRVYEGVTSTDAPLVVPEPMTLAMLGLGGLFIRRRKQS